MKKFGLQLRIPPGQQKQKASKPPIATPAFAFKDDDDEDNVEKEILRQAAKNRALEKVEEMHKKALDEDPTVFDYDGHYDEMKEKIARPRIQDKTERKSKYIETLQQKAKEREREHEIIYEKKLAKERSKDDHLYADKEKFMTRAYKEKLAERAKYLEEERLREIREEQEDVTKKKDLSEFYFGLEKNVAFGARLEDSRKLLKQVAPADGSQQAAGVSRTEATAASRGDKVHAQVETHLRSENQTRNTVTTYEVPEENTCPKGGNADTTSASEVPEGTTSPEGSNQKRDNTEEEQPTQTSEAYKRSEDAVAAARERFLARKRARDQL